MEQMTVGKLYYELQELMKKGFRDKVIIVSDDTEGNGFHGVYYSTNANPEMIKDIIDQSNGLTDSTETNPENLVLIG